MTNVSESMNHVDAIYHERQSLELCLLHALNNLFQGTAFTKQTLNEISYNNFMTNPHKSMLGTGNYDVNVFMTALHAKDCTAVWFDRRKFVVYRFYLSGNDLDRAKAMLCSLNVFDNRTPECLDLDHVIGFVLNVPSSPKIGPLTIPWYTRKHWLSIKHIAGAYHNLDSKLLQPQIIGDQNDLRTYLSETLQDAERQVFVVVSCSDEQDKSYLLPGYRDDTP